MGQLKRFIGNIFFSTFYFIFIFEKELTTTSHMIIEFTKENTPKVLIIHG